MLNKTCRDFLEKYQNNKEFIDNEYKNEWHIFIKGKYGISKSSIAKYLWTRPRVVSRTTLFDVEKARQMRADGISDVEIAKELNTYANTLWVKLWPRVQKEEREKEKKIYKKIGAQTRVLNTKRWEDDQRKEFKTAKHEVKIKKWFELVEIGMNPCDAFYDKRLAI